MSRYCSTEVKAVQSLHAAVLQSYNDFRKVKELLHAFAENLYKHYLQNDQRVTVEISNYHPLFIGQQADDILHRSFSMKDAHMVMAREYGFADWKKVPDNEINTHFESAVHYLLAGDVRQLGSQLSHHPELVECRSSFGHGATLLHYAGSNGVEIWRQQVPENLLECVKLLINQGADPTVTAHFYGGLYTSYELASTSLHPEKAGIAEQLLTALSIER